jgi:tRNA-binding EMAP/Myf-like protein
MNDHFALEIEKIKKLEKLIKSDIQKRDEQEKKNVPTSIVNNYNYNFRSKWELKDYSSNLIIY